MMDIVIKKKKKLPKAKWYLVAAIAVVPLFFAVKHLWFVGLADFSIDGNSLVYGQVVRGNFTASVRGTGVLVPANIQWLSANIDGTVVERAVKAGNVVKKGDLLLELSNPELVQRLAEAQYELEAMKAELLAARVEQESAIQQQETNLLNAKLAYDSSIYEYEARAELVKTGVVSRLDYQRSLLDRDQAEQRWLASQKLLKRMQENMKAQNNARDARLNQAQKSVAIIQQQVEGLQVRATMDSVVLEMPLESGQRVIIGDNIAKLAQQELLIAELQVPEIQIRDVTVGQQVIIDTRNNKIEGLVSRVDPAVVNGSVQVDVEFIGELPDDARPDLSVDGEIKIVDIEDTLYVSRPLFAQSRRPAVLYRVSRDGHFAEQVQVQLGYGSISQIQVLEGLQVGDRIITSDPSRFDSYERFRIN